jgi:hypothetical protein
LTIIESGFGTSLREKSISHKRVQEDALPDDQLDLLRSVLAHAYEKRQWLPLRILQALRDYIGPRTSRKPIIESLNIERKTDTA